MTLKGASGLKPSPPFSASPSRTASSQKERPLFCAVTLIAFRFRYNELFCAVHILRQEGEELRCKLCLVCPVFCRRALVSGASSSEVSPAGFGGLVRCSHRTRRVPTGAGARGPADPGGRRGGGGGSGRWRKRESETPVQALPGPLHLCVSSDAQRPRKRPQRGEASKNGCKLHRLHRQRCPGLLSLSGAKPAAAFVRL